MKLSSLLTGWRLPRNAAGGRRRAYRPLVENLESRELLAVLLGDATAIEGNSPGTRTLVFEATLDSASTEPFTVNFATADGTGRAGSDYVAASGQLTVAPGEPQSISVVVLSDNANEEDESMIVNLMDPATGNILASATGTITNDDAVPALSIGDATTTEGNTGTKNLSFTVRLSVASGQPVTVQYATADNSANSPGDYEAATGQITFQPGETAKTVVVKVNGDFSLEGNETFFVVLSDQENATISDAAGVGTITNDDVSPQISIGDVTVNEPANGETANAVFTVRLSNASDATVTVRFATASSTATAGSDFDAKAGLLTFAPGVMEQTIEVPVLGDGGGEAVQRFVVNLSAPTNASIQDGHAVGTIFDAFRPRVNSISAFQGPVGRQVTIQGNNFRNVTVVRFGGAAASSFQVLSPTKIVARVPAAARSGPISVTNRGGTGFSTQSFGVAPRITGFTPTRARVGSTVAINGKGLVLPPA